MVERDETLKIRNFLRTSDAQSLALFERLYKRGGFEQAVVCAHVEPGKAATHSLYVQLTPLKIGADDIDNFQLASRGGLQARGDINNLLIAEVEACYRPV